jgi:hypothetical protein
MALTGTAFFVFTTGLVTADAYECTIVLVSWFFVVLMNEVGQNLNVTHLEKIVEPQKRSLTVR